MNVGIICASIPAMPMFFRQHKLGLQSFNSLRHRLFGKSALEDSTSHGSSARNPAAKKKSFHGISLNMTSPSLVVKSNLGGKVEEYVELEEGNDQRGLMS